MLGMVCKIYSVYMLTKLIFFSQQSLKHNVSWQMALLHTVSQCATPVNQRAQYQGRGTGTYKWKAVTFNAITCAVPAAIYQNACGGKESKFVQACTGLRRALIMKGKGKQGV